MSRLLMSFGRISLFPRFNKDLKTACVSKDVNLCGFVSHKNQVITISIVPNLFQRFFFRDPRARDEVFPSLHGFKNYFYVETSLMHAKPFTNRHFRYLLIVECSR